jgi:hypothetical protein
MKESEYGTSNDVSRAESARARLAQDLREMSRVGERMMERTGKVGKNVLIGAGVLGILGIGALLFRKRRPQPFRLRGLRPERSFIGEALRSIVLSTLGVLAARAAQRIPLPEARPGTTLGGE